MVARGRRSTGLVVQTIRLVPGSDGGSLARLGNQPRILHRDDCLRGEVLQQCDLLVGEGPNFFAVNADAPEERLLCVTRR